MHQYLKLLGEILERGRPKEQRAVTADGKPLRTLSLFGLQARYDLRDGFPLVTTKKVKFDLIKEELLWFLSGSTSNRELNARGVTIWDEWADPKTGELGPIYGKQWRRWETPDGKTIDQIARLVQNIREVAQNPRHPAGRRLLLTAWNPADIERTRGPSACHTLVQFDVTEGRLSCQLYQRSADMFLGVPFNIASYALLTHLLAKVTDLEVGEFIHTFGDAHLYENHLPQVREQLSRTPYPLPRLILDDRIREATIWKQPAPEGTSGDLASEWIHLEGYRSHPFLRGEVAI